MSELIQKMKVYLIILTGQGDTEIKVVDQETWDWIKSSNPGKPKNTKKNSWFDQLVPKSQLDKIGEVPYITIGSFENDRALWSRNADGYQEYYYDTVIEAMKDIKKNGHEFEDEYSGEIY